MAHGERSPPPSLASFPDICAGRWRFAGEGLASMVSLSLIRTWLRLCGGRGRPIRRTDGDKRLFLARSHPFVRPHRRRHSIGQSIDFLRRPDAPDGIADSVDICNIISIYRHGDMDFLNLSVLLYFPFLYPLH